MSTTQPGGEREAAGVRRRSAAGEREADGGEERSVEHDAFLLDRQRASGEQRSQQQAILAVIHEPERDRKRRRRPQAGDRHVRIGSEHLRVQARSHEQQQQGRGQDRGRDAVPRERPDRPGESGDEQHELEVDQTRVHAAHQMEVEGLHGREAEWIFPVRRRVRAGERARVEGARDQAAVAVEQLRLERPVGVGVELEQRLGHGPQHERYARDGCNRRERATAARSVHRRPRPPAATREPGDQRRDRDRSQHDRRRRQRPRRSAAAARPRRTRSPPAGPVRSSRPGAGDPTCPSASGHPRPARTRMRVGGEQAGQAHRRTSTSQSGPNRQACTRMADAGAGRVRAAHEQPDGVAPGNLHAWREHELRPGLGPPARRTRASDSGWTPSPSARRGRARRARPRGSSAPRHARGRGSCPRSRQARVHRRRRQATASCSPARPGCPTAARLASRRGRSAALRRAAQPARCFRAVHVCGARPQPCASSARSVPIGGGAAPEPAADLRGLPAPMPPTNVLLTCAGMRGDMVMAFQAALAREGAGGVVVAADVSRLAPTLYLADRSALVPRGRRPRLRRVAARAVRAARHPRGAAADRSRPVDPDGAPRRLRRAGSDRRRLGSRDLRPVRGQVRRALLLRAARHRLAAHLAARASCPTRSPSPCSSRRGAASPHATSTAPTTPTSWRSSCATRPRSRWCRRSAAARSSRSTSSATSRGAASRPCRAR